MEDVNKEVQIEIEGSYCNKRVEVVCFPAGTTVAPRPIVALEGYQWSVVVVHHIFFETSLFWVGGRPEGANQNLSCGNSVH